jgi:membrane protein DedA with SNARE-associated domain
MRQATHEHGRLPGDLRAMSLEALISTYGYAAIAVGTFFEGETILVLGGFAAHQGYLKLPLVVVSAFFGTLLGDQLFFYIGRARGQDFLARRPRWKSRSEQVFSLLDKHQAWLILGFRFLYGLRTATPFVIGASGISPFRFLLLDGLGAGIWASVIGVLGYLFGYALESVLGNIKRYELGLFIGLAALMLLVWSVCMLTRKRASNATANATTRTQDDATH